MLASSKMQVPVPPQERAEDSGRTCPPGYAALVEATSTALVEIGPVAPSDDLLRPLARTIWELTHCSA